LLYIGEFIGVILIGLATSIVSDLSTRQASAPSENRDGRGARIDRPAPRMRGDQMCDNYLYNELRRRRRRMN
jgi:hypothetical protein